MLQRLLRFPSKIAFLVSSQRKVDQRTREFILPRTRRAELAEAAHLLAEQGLTCGALSELSVRLPGDRMAISAQNLWFAAAREEDFTISSLTHAHLILFNPRPAANNAWHRLVYQATQAEAVLLCHPRKILAYSFTPISLDTSLLPAASRELATIRWAAPEDEAIAAAAALGRVTLVRGIGLLVWAESLNAAAALAETAEILLHIHTNLGRS